MRKRLADASQYLAADEREILRLVYAADEPPVRAVAARLGLTVAETAARHARAIQALKARMTHGAVALPRAA